MDQILIHRPTGRRYANIREITGAEEQTINNTTTADAIKLIQQLLVETNDDALTTSEIGELTAWERDRLLAVVYRRLYGPSIDSTINCQNCEAPFDVDFILQDLMDNLAPNPEDFIQHLEENIFQNEKGIRFRLPTGLDECAVFGLPQKLAEAELFQRCVIDGDELDEDVSAEIQQAMQIMSPVVNLELDAKCPECNKGQTVQFDLQRFLLTALLNDRRRLLNDIHILASAYGWSLSEILNLPRSQRRGFVSLVDTDDALQKVRI